MPNPIIKFVFPVLASNHSIIRNLTAIRIIELNAKYLNQDKSPDPFHGAPGIIQRLNTCSYEEYHDKLKNIVDEYLSSSTLTAAEKQFFTNLLYSQACLQDNVIILHQTVNGQIQKYVWSISLSEVFALVYLTLKDTNLDVWPLAPGSDLLAEQGLRLRALTECIRSLKYSTRYLCQTSIASEFFLLINGAENKVLPYSLTELITKTIHDYLVRLLREYTGVDFKDDSDPKGEVRKSLQPAFNTIFLPWLLSGKMPENILNLYQSKGGALALKLKISHQLAQYGIYCSEDVLSLIDDYCSDFSISQWPCTFMPALTTFYHWLNDYARFFILDPSSQGSNLQERQTLGVIHLLGRNMEQWIEIIYHASKLFDTIIQYKELYHFDALSLLPNGQVKHDLIHSFASIEEMLSFTDGISGLILEPSYQSLIKSQLFLFLRGYHQWRTLSHYDFIHHFFYQWYTDNAEDLLAVRCELFIKMAELFFAENNNEGYYLIFVPDFILSRWVSPEKMSTYQVNRILLHAINYFTNSWTPLFFSYFSALIRHLPKTNHPARNHLAQFKILVDIYAWRNLGEKKPAAGIHCDIILSPQLQYSCESFKLVNLLCQQPNQNEALIEQLFMHIPYFNPNNCNEFGNTPLIQAAESGHYSLCRILIEHYPSLEATNFNGATALQVATSQGHYEICKLLIDAGANINACKEKTSSPLFIAVKNGCVKLVNLLLSHHANQALCNSKHYRPLDIAVMNDDVVMVNEFIQAGADLNQLNHHGQTPLHLAITENNTKLINFLIEGQFVNLEQKNKRGHTPLWHAVKKARLPIVKQLINAGASLSARNEDNENLAEFSLRIGCSRIHHYLRTLTNFKTPVVTKRQPSEQSVGFFASSSNAAEKESSPVKRPRI